MEEVVVRQKQALIFTQISKMIKAFCILLVSEMCKAMGDKTFSDSHSEIHRFLRYLLFKVRLLLNQPKCQIPFDK